MAVKTIDELIKETLTSKHKVEVYGGKGKAAAHHVDVSGMDHTFFEGSYASARARAEKYFNLSATGKSSDPGGKFGDKYDEVNKIIKENEGLADEVAEEYASEYSKKQLTKNQELLKRKAPAAYEKAGYGIEYHESAVKKLAGVRDDYLKKIDKAFNKEREKLGKSKTPANDQKIQALEHNKKFARQQVIDQFENAKEFHVERRDALQEFVRDLEAESKISAAEHMKKGAAQVEQGVSRELSAAEHAAGGAKPPSHIGFTAGGAAAGAIVGYVASDDENKARNTVIGGVVGGILGRIASGFKNAKVGLGVATRDPALLSQVSKAASHMHL